MPSSRWTSSRAVLAMPVVSTSDWCAPAETSTTLAGLPRKRVLGTYVEERRIQEKIVKSPLHSALTTTMQCASGRGEAVRRRGQALRSHSNPSRTLRWTEACMSPQSRTITQSVHRYAIMPRARVLVGAGSKKRRAEGKRQREIKRLCVCVFVCLCCLRAATATAAAAAAQCEASPR